MTTVTVADRIGIAGAHACDCKGDRMFHLLLRMSMGRILPGVMLPIVQRDFPASVMHCWCKLAAAYPSGKTQNDGEL